MPYRKDDEEEDERLQYTGRALLAYMSPIILIGALGSVAAWIVARRGAPRAVVRLLNFPAVFATSNFIGVSVVFAACFTYFLFKDGGRMPYERVTDFLDLTLYVVWGSFLGWCWDVDLPSSAYMPLVPWWHIAVFQAGVWFAIGRPLERMWLSLVMALAGRSADDSVSHAHSSR